MARLVRPEELPAAWVQELLVRLEKLHDELTA